MAEPTIWHNPKCSKSRQTLSILTDNGYEPKVRLYLEDVPSTTELKQVLQHLKLSPLDIIRKSEPEYKELDINKSDYTDNQLISLLHKHPKLIERPIVIFKKKAKIGRPPEDILELFK